MPKPISLVAACCRSHGIGKNGDLPWRLKKEMEFFSRITSTVSTPLAEAGDDQVKKNAVIMGITTYMCIPPRFRPLKDRVNVVLSRTARETPAGASYMFRSLSEAVETLSTLPEIDQLFVIGGESVYRESVTRPDAEFIFLTRIDADIDCDRFFPEVDMSVYEDLTDDSVTAPDKEEILKRFDIPEGVQTENGLSYKFHLYRRIPGK
ncbi:PREDICTED: dihydrofolate reductase-like [Rhagoletis zephyria]|uniref:dihydrofolate reductase-like n=1 Tax=Rhagoletis zephyria TaxID=28612 RepID=UPI00081153AF|nr:PREDICTED: dihydrofolate reductase-like [Rhagoletis zephyria]